MEDDGDIITLNDRITGASDANIVDPILELSTNGDGSADSSLTLHGVNSVDFETVLELNVAVSPGGGAIDNF